MQDFCENNRFSYLPKWILACMLNTRIIQQQRPLNFHYISSIDKPFAEMVYFLSWRVATIAPECVLGIPFPLSDQRIA